MINEGVALHRRRWLLYNRLSGQHTNLHSCVRPRRGAFRCCALHSCVSSQLHSLVTTCHNVSRNGPALFTLVVSPLLCWDQSHGLQMRCQIFIRMVVISSFYHYFIFCSRLAPSLHKSLCRLSVVSPLQLTIWQRDKKTDNQRGEADYKVS